MGFSDKIKRFVSEQAVLLIALGGFVLRVAWEKNAFYGMLGETLRDLNAVLDMMRSRNPVLIGPEAVSYGFHFGPIYDYILTPFLALFHFTLQGGYFAVAVFSMAAILVFYQLLWEWFCNRPLALWGAGLLAVCMYDIQNAYSLSHPNFLPFFIMLFLLGLTRLLRGNTSWSNALLCGLSFGITMQLDGTALFIFPLILIIVLLVKRPRLTWTFAAVGLLAAALVWVPYLIYELTHNFENLYGIVNSGASNTGFQINLTGLREILILWYDPFIFANTYFDLAGISPAAFWILNALLAVFLFYLWFAIPARKKSSATVSLNISDAKFLNAIWLGVSLVAFLLFQKTVYPHHALVLWPLPMVALAWFAGWLYQNSRRLFWFFIVLLLSSQIVQMAYFFPSIYKPQYSPEEFNHLMEAIRNDAGKNQYAITCAAQECGMFEYYLKLSGFRQAGSPNTDYVIKDTLDPTLVYLIKEPPAKAGRKIYSSQYFVIEKFEKNP